MTIPIFFSCSNLSDAAAGVIVEAFSHFPEWTAAILAGSPALPGSVRPLARYHLPDSVMVCDLDDPGQLLRLGLRPCADTGVGAADL